MTTMMISTEGQITIPTEIQEQLGLLPGTEVQLEVVGDFLQLRRQMFSGRGKKLVSSIRGKATNSFSTDEILSMTRENT